jgi:cobalt-zinc-cadmium efflux system protein
MTRTRRLTVSIALTVALFGVEVGFGVYAHSVALLADAGHNLTDVAGLLLALFAVRLVLRPRSAARSFGNHRATILAALANAVIITAVTLVIVAESLRRFAHPTHADATVMVWVAAGALVVNGFCVLVLRDGTQDLNMRAAVLHLFGDALASLAVLVAGVVLLVVPTATWADPASALVVAAIVLWQAVGVYRESVSVLLESTPGDVDLGRLTATMGGVAGVGEVHDLHVWSLSSEMRVLSAHLVLTGHPTLEEAQAVGDQVKRAIAVPFAISHSTLELECESCIDSQEDPCGMDTHQPVTAAVPHHH